MSTTDVNSTEVDSYQLETEVDRMMAQAAATDLGHPWQAIKSARARLVFEEGGDASDDVAWLSALHRELVDMGYDPDDRAYC